jgi:NDP-sugar pyrophosphorylase family protein
MKAMILAAGLGTRLKPLTDSKPKALLPLAGKPLLYYIINKLISEGINQIIINVHRFPDMIIDYVKREKNFGIKIEFSREEALLDTGGGLKKASWFFDDDQPFVLHNADVLSEIDLHKMVEYHNQKKPLASLAVRHRKTSRYLLFNQDNLLVGWQSLETDKKEIIGSTAYDSQMLSFMGIHILSPEIFSLLPPENNFSIINAYLDLARNGHHMVGYRNDEDFWVDLGRKENLQQAEKYLLSNKNRI